MSEQFCCGRAYSLHVMVHVVACHIRGRYLGPQGDLAQRGPGTPNNMSTSSSQTLGDKTLFCSGCERAITILPPEKKGEVKCRECGRLLWSVDSQSDVTVVNCTEYTLENRRDIILADLLASAGHQKILLNFGEVWRIGSESLGLLIHLSQKLQTAKGRLALCNVGPDIDRVLNITRLKRLLNIYGELSVALSSF